MLRGCSNHKCPLTLPWEALDDLTVWAEFLVSFNGRMMMKSSSPPVTLTLETDSSGSWGFGAIQGLEFFNGKWPDSLPRSSLSRLELYPIALAMHVWHKEMSNQEVAIYCDNRGTVDILKSLKADDPPRGP